MTKYITYLRVAILYWKQERVLLRCRKKCGFTDFTVFARSFIPIRCSHTRFYNEYEAKIAQLINEKNLHSN